MNEAGHAKAHLIAGLIFVLLIAHLPVAYTQYYHLLTGAPTAAGGIIDSPKFSAGQTVVLDGSWELYWNRLIISEPQPGEKPDFLIRVPDYWSRYQVNGAWLPAGGFASYRLTVQQLDDSGPIAVYIPDFGGAYRIYLDGQLASQSGIVSKNPKEVFTVPEAKLHPVTLTAGTAHEIVVEVATTRFSGLYMAPVMQPYDRAVQEAGDRDHLRFLLFGGVLFSFLALAVIYALYMHRKVRFPWLLAMIFFVLLRLMLTTEFYSAWQQTVFFHLSYEDSNPLMFLATFALKFLLLYLIQEQFGVSFSRKEKTGFFVYYAVLYLAYLFIPHGFYNRHLTILLPLCTFAMEIYCFFKLYRGRRQLKKLGVLVYWGVVVAISGLALDCYYINGNIYPRLSLALLIALTAYLMIVSLVYALRIADVYNEYALSTSRLELARSQIAMQSEYYDALSAQINEVRAIKHDMRHFIGVIRGLSSERRYEDLNQFLGESEGRADTDPLPVFCENAIVNSILGYYSLKAQQNGIPFHCVCAIPKRLRISDSDLCVVLGNALENALEACSKLDDPQARFLSVVARILNGQLLLKIENSYDGHVNIGADGYLSTKSGEFHGLGLRNIRKVMQAHGGFVQAEHEGTVFTLMAAFPNPGDLAQTDIYPPDAASL